jgi:hypothetical protein
MNRNDLSSYGRAARSTSSGRRAADPANWGLPLTEEGVLEAIARYFRAFVRARCQREEGTPVDLAEDAREVLERPLARLAAGGSEK